MRNILITIGLTIVVLFIGTLIALSDRSQDFQSDAPPAMADSNQSQIISFTELARGSHSKVTMRVNYFITSPTQLKELWQMVDASSTPPAIDFKTHAVLAVFAGQKTTAGHAITISKIEDTGARMVSITLANPDSACTPKKMAISPYEIVAVPTTSLSLAHEDISTTVSCP